MASHFRGPLLVSGNSYHNRLFESLDIEAVGGESDFVTAFDDFNRCAISTTFGDASGFEVDGWTLTDVGLPVADTIVINALSSGQVDSCLRINPGTAADTGGNMHFTGTVTSYNYPHLKIPSTAVSATILDNTDWVFACRLGLLSNAATWDGKLFIGFAEEGDTGLLTAANGEITLPEGGPLVGFHCRENGQIRGISQRTVNTAYAEGTNFTELYAAASPDGNTGVAWWVDLAFRMSITDMSDNSANGTTTFYHRRVRSKATDATLQPWIKHPTVLSNQTPNNNVNLVPAIEVVNGPANQSDVLVDWWAFGATRPSRR